MKTIIKVILGAVGVSALAMTTGVIPNPFADEQREAASHKIHEMKIQWRHDGKFETMPIVEQGTPFDDTKYFDMPAGISENPTDLSGVYKFNFEIEQFFNVDGYTGTIRYKVNSNDNSIYMSGTDIVENPLFSSVKNNPYLRPYTIEFLIRNSQSDVMLFLNHNEEGKLCLKAPTGLNFSDVLTDTYLKSLEVLNSAKDNSVVVDRDSPLEAYRGKYTLAEGGQKEVTFWFAKEEAQIPTGVPLMGFGVGVFKDVLEKKQKFLAITEMPEGVMKLIHLEKIEEWGVNTKNYKVIPFDYHLQSGMERANDIVSWLKGKQEEIARLREQRKNCPPHQQGSECRRNYEQRTKAIEKEIAERAKELSKTLMIPIN